MPTTTTRRRPPQFSGRRMGEILDGVEPRLRRGFLAMIERVRGALPQDALADLIANGRVIEAERAFEDAARLFAREVSDVYSLAGEEAAAFMANALDVVVGFDQFAERAVSKIRESELSLIREFRNEQRDVVRAVIQEGIARGENPREQARHFRESIGLTSRQEQAVQRYRSLLEAGSREALDRQLRDRRFDRTVERSIREGEPLGARQVDLMVARYAERFVKQRAETIARTEALRAIHEGADEGFKQIIQAADVNPRHVIQIWNTALDGRVRDDHVTMHGQEVPFGEPFIDGSGNRLAFPGDPSAPPKTTVQCRCVVSTRISIDAISP